MGPEYSDERIPKLMGYEVSQVMTVTLTDLSKYEDLLTGALKAGINRVNGISFVVADSRKYREEARLKAVQAAREKATAMAAELGQIVEEPWDVTEEAADFDAGMYLALNARQSLGSLPAEDRQGARTIAGGEVTIRAAVRLCNYPKMKT